MPKMLELDEVGRLEEIRLIGNAICETIADNMQELAEGPTIATYVLAKIVLVAARVSGKPLDETINHVKSQLELAIKILNQSEA